jgi:hypothetical protein
MDNAQSFFWSKSESEVKRTGHKRKFPAVTSRRCPFCLETEEPGKRTCSRAAENVGGQNGLHILCQDRNAPFDHVRILMDAHPELLERKDVYGRSVGCLSRDVSHMNAPLKIGRFACRRYSTH